MKLRIIDQTGDTEVIVEENVDYARQLFEEAISNGKFAFARVGSDNHFVTNFDELFKMEATEVVIATRQAGG